MKTIAEAHALLTVPFLTAESAESQEGSVVALQFVVIMADRCLVSVASLCTDDVNSEAVLWPDCLGLVVAFKHIQRVLYCCTVRSDQNRN